jgi:phosphatidylinositol alpha-1,6-mannosyltransferase
VTHVLVTNDFPPKVGGIQSYLWELWRRLPAGEATVLTTAWAGAAEWDAAQPFRIERTRQRVLLPTGPLVEQVQRLVADVGASLVVLDPALPLGLIGPRLGINYAVVVHGAEVTVPGRLPATRQLLRRVLRPATGLIAAGGYPAAEAAHALGHGDRLRSVAIVPPGVDVERFRVLAPDERAKARADLGLPTDGRLVVSVSRLVPRKGMDTLVDAAARLALTRRDLVVAIAGTGRDESRLRRRISSSRAPVRLLGRVADDQLAALYGCADVFAMLCRDRWGGLEQEGFGIVFLEAAACGVPAVAGRSGGAAEAVEEGTTGTIVDRPADMEEAAAALGRLLDDDELRLRQGAAARRRAETEFSYDVLTGRLATALSELQR